MGDVHENSQVGLFYCLQIETVLEFFMKTKKKKVREPKVPVPTVTSLEEAANSNRTIAEHLRTARELELVLEKQIEKLKEDAQKEIARHHAKAKAIATGVFLFVNTNRDALLAGADTKTLTLLQAGSCRWYATPEALEVDDEEATLATLKTLGLTQYIRTIEEIDKEALKKEPSTIQELDGVRLISTEKFVLYPPGTPERIERPLTGKGKKKFAIVRPKKKK